MSKKKKGGLITPMAAIDTSRPRILVIEGLSGADRCVRGAGGGAVSLSPHQWEEIEVELSPDRCQGLLLTGGGDVDPRKYGEKPSKEVYGVDQVRDAVEIYALAAAEDFGWPVLGICRGHQIMNVQAGGSLYQHVPAHSGWNHEVEVKEGSLLRTVIGGKDMYVNSYHHQQVKQPGNGFMISAIADDGVAEAIESADGRCIGVQFHPEMGTSWNDNYWKIFRWLVIAAAVRSDKEIPEIPARISESELILPTTVKDPTGSFAVKWTCPKCNITYSAWADWFDHKIEVHGGASVTYA